MDIVCVQWNCITWELRFLRAHPYSEIYQTRLGNETESQNSKSVPFTTDKNRGNLGAGLGFGARWKFEKQDMARGGGGSLTRDFDKGTDTMGQIGADSILGSLLPSFCQPSPLL